MLPGLRLMYLPIFMQVLDICARDPMQKYRRRLVFGGTRLKRDDDADHDEDEEVDWNDSDSFCQCAEWSYDYDQHYLAGAY